MSESRKRGRPKKVGGALTPRERMARQRQRKAVINEKLFQHGISQQTIYVDDFLFSRLKQIANRDKNYTVHDLVFLAMRKFLDDLPDSPSYENYRFNLRPAILAAHQSVIDQGLDGLFSAVEEDLRDQDLTEEPDAPGKEQAFQPA